MTILRKDLTKSIPNDILLDIASIFESGLYAVYKFSANKGEQGNRTVEIKLVKGETLRDWAKKILD